MFKPTSKNIRVPVNLSPELHRQLKSIAKKQASPISTVIKQQIETSLNVPNKSSQTIELTPIANLLTIILKKSIRSTALLNHASRHVTQQDMAVLEKFCDDEFQKLIGRLKD